MLGCILLPMCGAGFSGRLATRSLCTPFGEGCRLLHNPFAFCPALSLIRGRFLTFCRPSLFPRVRQVLRYHKGQKYDGEFNHIIEPHPIYAYVNACVLHTVCDGFRYHKGQKYDGECARDVSNHQA